MVMVVGSAEVERIASGMSVIIVSGCGLAPRAAKGPANGETARRKLNHNSQKFNFGLRQGDEIIEVFMINPPIKG
jgi:hypothetical protein